jgi:hypothetical protein
LDEAMAERIRRAEAGDGRGGEKNYLNRPQPIEKSRFGKIKENKKRRFVFIRFRRFFAPWDGSLQPKPHSMRARRQSDSTCLD